MAINNNQYNIPYLNIVNLFQTACNQHEAIASFDTGTIDYLDASSQSRKYPYIFLRPMASNYTTALRTLSFELYSLDIPKAMKSQSNTELISDTEMYIYDIMAWFNFQTATNYQTVGMNLNGCIPVQEGFQDRVFGWVGNVDVTSPFALDYCDYPEYP